MGRNANLYILMHHLISHSSYSSCGCLLATRPDLSLQQEKIHVLHTCSPFIQLIQLIHLCSSLLSLALREAGNNLSSALRGREQGHALGKWPLYHRQTICWACLWMGLREEAETVTTCKLHLLAQEQQGLMGHLMSKGILYCSAFDLCLLLCCCIVLLVCAKGGR